MGGLRVAVVAVDIAYRLVDVAVDHYQIEPAIKVQIREHTAKTEAAARGLTDAVAERDIGVNADAVRAVHRDHFIIEIRDGNTGCAGVIEIGDVDSHSRPSLAIVGKSHPGFHGDVFKASVTQIAIELVGLGIVGDEQIGPTVMIVVEHGHTQ